MYQTINYVAYQPQDIVKRRKETEDKMKVKKIAAKLLNVESKDFRKEWTIQQIQEEI